MNRKWLKLSFYCALLSISFLTEFFHPTTKQLFCTPLRSMQGTPQVNHTPDNSSSLDREK